LSPRSGKSDDNEEILIDFTTLELLQSSPISDLAVPDAGEILLVGPNFTSTRPFDGVTFGKLPQQSETTPAATTSHADDTEDQEILIGPDYTGTWPSNGGTFGEFPRHLGLQMIPPVTDTDVADDVELLQVSPNFTGTLPFLDGGKFGEFSSSETGIRSTTNPFLADVLVSSSASDASATGFSAADCRLFHDGYTAGGYTVEDDDLLIVGPDTGTGVAFRRSPFTARGLSPSFDQFNTGFTTRLSPGSGAVTSCFQSDTTLSHPFSVTVSHPLSVTVSHPVTVPSASVVCETNLDEAMWPTSPVAFVVS